MIKSTCSNKTKRMKSHFFSTTLATVLAICTLTSHAQPAPPHPEGPRGPREMHDQPLQRLMAFSGQAGEWVANDDYVYDGFYLQTGEGKLLVKFPAHMGNQLTRAIKSGSSITVNGAEHANPEGIREIRMFDITVNGKTFSDTPRAVPGTPKEPVQSSGSGKITALQKARDGKVNGFVIDGKTILRMPPHVVTEIGSLVNTGTGVSFTGVKKSLNDGEAQAGNYTVIHCQTLTINGTQYLVR
jgi:hypothetical protein